MLSSKMLGALNRQINAEMWSSYLYLSMSAWFQSRNLPGFASWMRVQSGEETTHAMKFFDYIHDRRGDVKLAALAEPQTEWASPLAAFEAALEHEQKITAMIGGLMAQASKENDYATASMLQWFVNEQVEEEAAADEIVQKLRMIGDSTNGLLMLDHQLAKRGS
jgi:ferritin